MWGLRNAIENVSTSILYKMSAPTFPEELREYLFANCNLEQIKNSEIQNLVKVYKEQGMDAVKDSFDLYQHGRRVYRQIRYNVDQLSQAIENIEKARANIEQYGQTEHNFGEEIEGDEINKSIHLALEKCSYDLKQEWERSMLKLNDVMKRVRDNLEPRSAQRENRIRKWRGKVKNAAKREKYTQDEM